ncbi:hypothetical protein, partial [Streptomyces caniscabiei]|uniref:hypothetical protein n=1 Tax=Streptomyces caniscabiei TaxID=2746961 RepID=UPI001C5002EC
RLRAGVDGELAGALDGGASGGRSGFGVVVAVVVEVAALAHGAMVVRVAVLGGVVEVWAEAVNRYRTEQRHQLDEEETP